MPLRLNHPLLKKLLCLLSNLTGVHQPRALRTVRVADFASSAPKPCLASAIQTLTGCWWVKRQARMKIAWASLLLVRRDACWTICCAPLDWRAARTSTLQMSSNAVRRATATRSPMKWRGANLIAAADCTHPAETDSCAWALRCAKSAKNPGKPFVTAHAHPSLRRCARHRHLPSRLFAAQSGG